MPVPRRGHLLDPSHRLIGPESQLDPDPGPPPARHLPPPAGRCESAAARHLPPPAGRCESAAVCRLPPPVCRG
jgi:hypothetical protein